MSTIIAKTLDALYLLVALALAIGIVFGAASWLTAHLPMPSQGLPTLVAAGALVLAMGLSAWLAEGMLPLLAEPEPRWVYYDRPLRVLHVVDSETWIQVAVFAIVGLLLGATIGLPLLGSATSCSFRVLCGVRWKLRLPGLLQAGKTRLVTTGLWTLYDAANTSAGLAATWLRRNPKANYAAPTANTWVLFCRRVARRSYLLVLFAIQLLLVVATAHLDSKVALLFVFAWAILGAGFYRAADLSQLGVRSVVPSVVLLIHGCIAAIAVHLAWGYTHPLMGAIATVVAVVWISQRRGADRAAVQPAASVDPGLGVAVPTDALQYHGRGLRFGSVAIGLIWYAL